MWFRLPPENTLPPAAEVVSDPTPSGEVEHEPSTKSGVNFPGREQPVYSKTELCDTVVSVAAVNNLPVGFFSNLIHQESGFKPHVISPVGAQGIAQFMPRVAAAYGLANPFDRIAALTASAKLLAELVDQFGNLGLAAAAYNAGPKRVQDWLARKRGLPAETRKYVQSITGRAAEHWVLQGEKETELSFPPRARCPDLINTAGNELVKTP
jgi:soluble lytic murein transglycosylase-like protein